jgi:CspA family cold shock protein
MPYYGKIKNYDGNIGKGRITPENGDDVLAFRKSDLKDEAGVPILDERYRYDVRDADNGKRYAINVHAQVETAITVEEQARNQVG